MRSFCGSSPNQFQEPLFDALFTPEAGIGYPPQREEPQRQARALLQQVSGATHRPMAEILQALPEEVLHPVLTFPAFRPLLEQAARADAGLCTALEKVLKI